MILKYYYLFIYFFAFFLGKRHIRLYNLSMMLEEPTEPMKIHESKGITTEIYRFLSLYTVYRSWSRNAV